MRSGSGKRWKRPANAAGGKGCVSLKLYDRIIALAWRRLVQTVILQSAPIIGALERGRCEVDGPFGHKLNTHRMVAICW